VFRISQVKATMTDDDEGSVVTLVTSVESVVSVVTAVEPAEFIQVEDEVDQDEVDQGGVEVDEVMEEEDYDDDQSGDLKFGGNHPICAGTRLSSRYHAVKKLGSGAFAQVWQCKDVKEDKQVAVKVLKGDSAIRDMGQDEVEMLRSIKKCGKGKLLGILDNFFKDGPNGKHVCIVTELLGPSLLECLPPAGMCLENVKQLTGQVLAGLEYLHNQVRIIHTDVKPENVLLGKNFGTSSFEEKVDGIIVKLADLGCALKVGETYPAIVGTSEYRAPELLLEAPYDVEIDIWATACLSLELATGKYLFKPEPSERMQKEEMHLAMMTKLLGPVPQEMVKSGRAGRTFYSRRTGELHHFPPHSLQDEDLATLVGERRGKAEAEDEAFSKFLLPMLELLPQRRATACKALDHPFLVREADVKAAKVVQKVRLSIVEKPLSNLQDLRRNIAEVDAVDQLVPKVKKRKSPEVVEAAEFESVGNVTRSQHLTEELDQVEEDSLKETPSCKPGEDLPAGAAGAGCDRRRKKVRLSIEEPLDTLRDSGMTLLTGSRRQRKKGKRRKRSSEVVEASDVEKNTISQIKKTRRDEKEQGSKEQDAVISRKKSPTKTRKAYKVARLTMKKEARQSMALGSEAIAAPSKKVEVQKKFNPEASKAIGEGQPGLPLMDEILPEVLVKVAVKGLVTGKALVEHVAKNYPELGVKADWLRKLKEALSMEVARGNLLQVSGLGLCGTFKLKESS